MTQHRTPNRAGYLLLAALAGTALPAGFVILLRVAPMSAQSLADPTAQVLLPFLVSDEITPTVILRPTPRPGGCVDQPGDNPVLEWDPELDELETVHLVTTTVAVGEVYWRLICAQWYLPGEGPGPDHHIMIDTLDESGARALGVKVRITVSDTVEFGFSEDKADRYALDRPMFHTLGTYAAQPDIGVPADVVEGMGTGLFPNEGTHTSFLLIWQATRAARPEPTGMPTATTTTTGAPTITLTPTITVTPTITPTAFPTPTVTAPRTIIASPTVTATPTITASPTTSVTDGSSVVLRASTVRSTCLLISEVPGAHWCRPGAAFVACTRQTAV